MEHSPHQVDSGEEEDLELSLMASMCENAVMKSILLCTNLKK